MFVFTILLLTLVTLSRIPSLKSLQTPHPSRLTYKDMRVRRDFMRISVIMTSYSLLSWIPDLILSTIVKTHTSIIYTRPSVLIISDVCMCLLFVNPSVVPILIVYSLVWAHHPYKFEFPKFDIIGHVRVVIKRWKLDVNPLQWRVFLCELDNLAENGCPVFMYVRCYIRQCCVV